jgi:D-alanyl-D-alanine carboxypeptidase/D-alanyl-D-alanine-endopeptidase (penicillin-binding protein 4)
MTNHTMRFAPAMTIAAITADALVVPATTAAGTAAPATTAAGTSAIATGTIPATVSPWPGVQHLMPSFLRVEAVQSTEALETTINKRLARRITNAPLGPDVSMRVEDLATGRRIYGKRTKQGMIPASNMKLATALAALSAYGKDHVLPTTVRKTATGRRIFISGGGDPLLSSANIDALAQKAARRVQNQGLPTKKLRVRYDASLFAPATLPSAWPGYYFYRYSTKPTALMRDRLLIADPAKDAAAYFQRRLRAHGLKGHVRAKVKPARAPSETVQIASHTSHTVGDALWRMLRFSDNTVAEVMVRHVALSQGKPTTPTGSAAALRSELSELGVPLRNARFHDGSGLSRDNRLPAKTLTGIVRASMDPNRPDLSSPYRWLSVPVAGRTGTLTSRFKRDSTRCAIGLVVAKTGTLYDVVSLSGVAVGNDGRHRAFSILVNNRPSGASLSEARHRVDRLAAALTGCV